MSCKYNNSMYNTNPPSTVIISINPQQEYLEEMIAEHNFEESYELNEISILTEIEMDYIKELIKHEPRGVLI